MAAQGTGTTHPFSQELQDAIVDKVRRHEVTASWDDLWTKFKGLVQSLNEAVRPEERGFVVRIDKHANDVFPFRAMASYSPASSPGDEVLVLSVDFKRTGDTLEGQVDLARGHGLVLADEQLGPAFEEDEAALGTALGVAGFTLERFVAAHRGVIEEELRSAE